MTDNRRQLEAEAVELIAALRVFCRELVDRGELPTGTEAEWLTLFVQAKVNFISAMNYRPARNEKAD
jgi:hypothetical protein